MTHWFQFDVAGDPAPQGSKRALRNKAAGKIQLVESSGRVKPWRQDVRQAVRDNLPAHWGDVWRGPVGVAVTFAYARPKGHYGTGRNADQLKDSAPAFPAGGRNDADKLARAVLDAIESTGLVFANDGQVVHLDVMKTYTTDPVAPDKPGARIQVWKMRESVFDARAALGWGAGFRSAARPDVPTSSGGGWHL